MSPQLATNLVMVTATVIVYTTACAAEPKPSPPRTMPHAIYAPLPHVPTEARVKHLKGDGMFILNVRSDGTIARVGIVQSTGHAVLDNASIDAFSRWRFDPDSLGSVKKIKIPVTYNGKYPKE
jgi:periplasmic protein TonB